MGVSSHSPGQPKSLGGVPGVSWRAQGACQLNSSSQERAHDCASYLEVDLFVSLRRLLQYRKVVLLVASLGESQDFCGWAGSKSAIMS